MPDLFLAQSQKQYVKRISIIKKGISQYTDNYDPIEFFKCQIIYSTNLGFKVVIGTPTYCDVLPR